MSRRPEYIKIPTQSSLKLSGNITEIFSTLQRKIQKKQLKSSSVLSDRLHFFSSLSVLKKVFSVESLIAHFFSTSSFLSQAVDSETSSTILRIVDWLNLEEERMKRTVSFLLEQFLPTPLFKTILQKLFTQLNQELQRTDEVTNLTSRVLLNYLECTTSLNVNGMFILVSQPSLTRLLLETLELFQKNARLRLVEADFHKALTAINLFTTNLITSP